MRVNTNKWNKIRYTIIAPGYDIAAGILDGSRKKSIKNLEIIEGSKVLIVGCGTGLDLEYLPKGCHITATDITPKMVELTKARNKKIGHNLNALVMDGQNLELNSNEFDFVLLHLIISVIPDPYACIKEVERVVKPDGKVSVFDKFVADGTKPSFARKTANIITNTLFSDITRSFEDIASHTKLVKTSDIKANFGGKFRIIQMRKLAKN